MENFLEGVFHHHYVRVSPVLRGNRDFEHYVPLENVDPKSEPLVQWAEEYSIAHPGIDYFLFGHRHVLLRHALQSDGEVLILGDWIRHFTYACFDGQKMEICSYN